MAVDLGDVDFVKRELRRQIGEILILLDNGEREISTQDADYIHRRLDQLWREVFLLSRVYTINDSEDVMLGISNAIGFLRTWEEITNNSGYQAPLQQTGSKGRPRYEITRQQLEYFILNGFKGTDIADMLCVSLRTVR